MIRVIICMIAAAVCLYMIVRYFSLCYAIRKVNESLEEVCRDLTRNQMVFLPLPNRHLGKLLCNINAVLEAAQKERQQYEKRERVFQKQIENISHDLRTPLTVILGYVKLYKKKQEDEGLCAGLAQKEELEETIAVIERKAEAMKHLVTQFYDYSRLNAHDYELTLASVDVSRILRESLMGSYQVLEQSRLKVEVCIPEHPVFVAGDAAALERIFQNMFQNAGRYADTFFRVLIEEQAEGTSVLFLNDTRRLTKQDLPFVFDRFYIQDNSRNRGGTGLGLTVSKSLAEEMNGTLTAKILEHEDADGGEKNTVCFELKLRNC